MVVKLKHSSSFEMDSSNKPKRPTVKHVGNDIKLTLETNPNNLILVGNYIRVEILCNEGNVKIIGDSCKLSISLNYGSVHYVGNRGTVFIGNESKSTDVKYTGNGGTLKFLDGTDMMVGKKFTKTSDSGQENKKKRKKCARIYSSDSALNANSVLLNCNKLLTDYPVNLCCRSVENFVTSSSGGNVFTTPCISVVNGSVTINNYHS